MSSLSRPRTLAHAHGTRCAHASMANNLASSQAARVMPSAPLARLLARCARTWKRAMSSSLSFFFQLKLGEQLYASSLPGYCAWSASANLWGARGVEGGGGRFRQGRAEQPHMALIRDVRVPVTEQMDGCLGTLWQASACGEAQATHGNAMP